MLRSRLSGRTIRPEASCCVVIASANYPASSPNGLPVAGLDAADALVFHAGTRRESDGYVTARDEIVRRVTLLLDDLVPPLGEAIS